jgi:hypothetical protein
MRSALDQPLATGRGGIRDLAPSGIGAHNAVDQVAIAALIALVLGAARPPLYDGDGFVYQLLGRDLAKGMNPHHLLWNAMQALVVRLDALLGIRSLLPLQLVGMACGVLSGVLLYRLLLGAANRRDIAFVATLFVVFAPWTWFMAFQNQPYALMFLLLIVLLGCCVTPDGAMPRGWRFAAAAASAVGMVMLQQAAVLIVIGAAVCFFAFGGWRRATAWLLATGVPIALVYALVGGLVGVRSLSEFWRWTTDYLRSQHSLQTRFPDSLAKSVMGIVSAFLNQEPLKNYLVNEWSASAILWFYGAVGVCLLAAAAIVIARRRGTRYAKPSRWSSLEWLCAASAASWSIFCFFWEPTNYYWFVLLAPFFVWLATDLRPIRRTPRILLGALCLATLWNLYANHAQDVDGAQRAPEPQMRIIERHLTSSDLLWVADLGWSGDVDYDLLSTTARFDHAAPILAVSDVVGRSRDAASWERALADSSRARFQHSARVFISGRVFNPETFERTWEDSPFADYTEERSFPVDWASLGRELPAFIRRTYDVVPAGFSVGSDSIWRLEPRRGG